MRTIEIIIAADGSSSVEAKGFAGASCLEATRRLESLLGQKTSDRLTSEFHATNYAAQTDRQRLQSGEG